MAKRVAGIKPKIYYVECGTPSTMQTSYAKTTNHAEVGQAVTAAEKFLRKAAPHLSKFDRARLPLVEKTIEEIRETCFLVSNWTDTSAINRMGWTVDLDRVKLRVEMWRV